MSGEDSLERVVFERKLERVAANEGGLRRLAPGLVEHRLALVEADHLAREMARQEAGAAGHVERPGRRQSLERPPERLQLLVPARAFPGGEAAGPAVPLVVLRSPGCRSTPSRS